MVNARKIAKDLYKKYGGKVWDDEDISILEDMDAHPLYEEGYFWLNVIWNEDDSVGEIEVGTLVFPFF